MKPKILMTAAAIFIFGTGFSGFFLVNTWRHTPYGLLHPNAAILLKFIKIRGMDLFADNHTPSEIRQIRAKSDWLVQKKPAPVARVKESFLPGPDGPVPVRIYSPSQDMILPVIIYYHGGGWMMGSLDSHDNVCRSLSNKIGAIVISVDYRLAPENPFPAALNDAYAALLWVSQKAATLNADPSKIVVAGDSAGGNLAAAVSMMARDKKGPFIAAQVLIYPVTNIASMATQSYARFANGFFLTKSYMAQFRSMYLADVKDRDNVYASPLLSENLSGLAPAIVLTAEFDPLRDEGERYAEKLKQAGVPVSRIRFKGMIHGFVSMDRLFNDAGLAVDRIAVFLNPHIK